MLQSPIVVVPGIVKTQLARKVSKSRLDFLVNNDKPVASLSLLFLNYATTAAMTLRLLRSMMM